MPHQKLKLMTLVSNDLTADPRVRKQLGTASRAGFKTIGLGWSLTTNNLPFTESVDGYKIIRGVPDSNRAISKKLIRVRRSLIRVIEVCSQIKRFSINRLKAVLYWTIERGSQLKQRFFKQPKPFKKEKTIMVINEKIITQKNCLTESIVDESTIQQNNFSRSNWLFRSFNSCLNALFQFMASAEYYLEYYIGMNSFFVKEAIKFKPDIVHANDLDTLYAGYLIKQKTGAKLIYDAHEVWTKQGLRLPKILLFGFSLLEWFLIRKVDAFVSVNESIITEIEKMYHYKFRVPKLAVYNCPTYQKIKPCYKKSSRVKVIYQGRYCFDRGLEELTESARYLPQNVVIYFRALGDPPTKARLIEIRNKYGLNDKIKFLKPVPMDKMVDSAKNYDIGVISYIPTNINNKLCTPNKLFEYMMAGLALACSDLPELRRIIREHQNGTLFNPRNPRSIAKAIKSIAISRSKLQKMKKNSLESAKIWNWREEEKKLINLYWRLYANKTK